MNDNSEMKYALKAIGLTAVLVAFGVGLIFGSSTSLYHWFQTGVLYVPQHAIFPAHYVTFEQNAEEFRLAFGGHVFLFFLGLYSLAGAIFAKS